MKKFLLALALSGLCLAASARQCKCFYAEPLSDELFGYMQGRSFNEPAPVTRDDLRLLHLKFFGFDGEVHKGEMVCHKDVADDLLDIFRALFKEKYPIESIRLVDDFGGDDNASMAADNTSCLNIRKMVGGSKFSKHAYGVAVDVNPLYNPYVKGTHIEPSESAPYVDRTLDFPHKLTADDLCVRLFKAHGWTWGGDWKSLKDWQHFEKEL